VLIEILQTEVNHRIQFPRFADYRLHPNRRHISDTSMHIIM
jgi:hypothetical protein